MFSTPSVTASAFSVTLTTALFMTSSVTWPLSWPPITSSAWTPVIV